MKKQVCLLTTIPGIEDYFMRNKDEFEAINVVTENLNISDFEIIVIDPPMFSTEMGKQIFSNESKVKWIHSTYAGVDGLISKVNGGNFPPYRPILTKTGFYLRFPMFEYVLQHVLNEENNYQAVIAMNKKALDYQKTQESVIRNFRPKDRLRIGILGYGNIGKYIADSFVRCFGVKDISIFKKKKPEGEHNGYKFFDEVDTFLSSEYDYLISVLPSTPETKYLLNFDNLSKNLKKMNHTVFINIGRGSLIRTEDLVEVMEKGILKKAIVDVTETEPLPDDSKLWNYYPEKIILTPHCAGWSSPEQSFFEFQRLFGKYVEGKELDYVVKWDNGY